MVDDLHAEFSRRIKIESDALMLADRSLSLKLLRFSWIECHERYHFPRHEHFFYEVIVPRVGLYKCRLNDKDIEVKPGNMLFIQPLDTHEDFYSHGAEIIFMVFGIYDSGYKAWNPEVFSGNQPLSSRIIALNANQAPKILIEQIIKQKRNSVSEIIGFSSLAEAFFWQVILSIPNKQLSSLFVTGQEHSVFMRVVFNFFEQNCRRKLNVKELAAELQMSKRSLEYKFRKIFGFSPVQTFNAYKTRLASRMLAQGATVKDTAEYFGYTDQFYFSTVFKRMMGHPPSQGIGKKINKS